MISKLGSSAVDTVEDAPCALGAFREASAKLINLRALQQRVDRKYLLPQRLLDPLLTQLKCEYQAVLSGGRMVACYHNLYFDTPDLQSYEDHRRGRNPRYKVRVRHYVDRRLSVLEIKRKVNTNRTVKTRLDRPFGESELNAEARLFVEKHSSVGAELLVPRLWIAFRRITLVGEHVNERITFDWGIEVFDDRRKDLWPHVVIVEVKQAHYSSSTPGVRGLRKLHIAECAISKYCLATAKLAAVRSNAFKPVLRAVERLSIGEICLA